jgi:hypothetical protein
LWTGNTCIYKSEMWEVRFPLTVASPTWAYHNHIAIAWRTAKCRKAIPRSAPESTSIWGDPLSQECETNGYFFNATEFRDGLLSSIIVVLANWYNILCSFFNSKFTFSVLTCRSYFMLETLVSECFPFVSWFYLGHFLAMKIFLHLLIFKVAF